MVDARLILDHFSFPRQYNRLFFIEEESTDYVSLCTTCYNCPPSLSLLPLQSHTVMPASPQIFNEKDPLTLNRAGHCMLRAEQLYRLATQTHPYRLGYWAGRFVIVPLGRLADVVDAGKTPWAYSSVWRRRTKSQVCGESQAEAAEFDPQKCSKE
jgi:hypothetical protein